MQLVCPACGTTNRVPEDRLRDEPACGRCHAPLMAGKPAPMDDTTLPAFLAGTELPIVVDFWAEWCGPCRMMAPQFEAAARQMPQVRFVKVDTDASPQVSVRNRIRSIPTLVLFHKGQELARVSGAMQASQLMNWIDTELARAGR